MFGVSGSSPFPEGFLWGAAVSAYQVEGSPLADGAGASIWHRFTHTPGLVSDGETGDVACDHYRRYGDDVRLMRELGLTAFRFSVSWGRVLPEGRGRVNAQGLDFYERLVDALLEQRIRPFVTLFHWDLPAALDDRGGWLNPDIAGWFAEYGQRPLPRARRPGRDVDDLERAVGGRRRRVPSGQARARPRSLFEAPIASHNLLRAHAEAVRAYRAEGKHAIGLVVNLEPKYPASQEPRDVAATARADAYMNRQYLDPVFFGRYPEELPEIFGEAWPDFPPGEIEAIREPIDFLGVNYYTRSVTRDDPSACPVRACAVYQKRSTHTETNWEVYPPGLADTLLACPGALRRRAALRHGERRRLLRSSGGGRRDSRGSSARRLPQGAPASGAGGRSEQGSICEATSSGRSSTTSSGATATRSASASCTSTTRPSGARPRRAPVSTPT